MRTVLVALLFLAACTASSPTQPAIPAASPPPDHPFGDIQIEPTSIVAGGSVTMSLKLAAGPTELSLLRLSITYPNGHVQTVVESIYGADAALSWDAPAEIGQGTASYRLSAEGCGCGPDDKGQISESEARTTTGEFVIQR